MSYPAAAQVAFQSMFADPTVRTLIKQKLQCKPKQIELPPCPTTDAIYDSFIEQLIDNYFLTEPNLTEVITETNVKVSELLTFYQTHRKSVATAIKHKQHDIYLDYLQYLFVNLNKLNKPDESHLVVLKNILYAYFNLRLHQPLPGACAMDTRAIIKNKLRRQSKSEPTTISKIKELFSQFDKLLLSFNRYFYVDKDYTITDFLLSGYINSRWLDLDETTLTSKEALEQYKLPAMLEKYFNGEASTFIYPLMQKRYGTIANTTPELSYCLDLTKILPDKSNFNIALIGCHGIDHFSSKAPGQNKLANTQHAVAAKIKQLDCDMGLQLGDNAYFNGIGYMQGYFFEASHALYAVRPNLSKMFWGIVAGNHEYGCWGHPDREGVESVLTGDKKLTHQNGLQRLLNQVLHTYVDNDGLHMPNRYYVMVHKNFAIVVIDSNTLIYDKPQQNWIINTVEKLAQQNKKIIIAAHHPLIYIGKRAEVACEWYNDYVKHAIDGGREGKATWIENNEHYQPVLITPEGEQLITPFDPKDLDVSGKQKPHLYNNIGKFLLAFVNLNKLNIDVWCCAHEHSLNVMRLETLNGQKITQVVAGGAGARIQKITKINPDSSFKGHSDLDPVSPHIKIASLQCELAADKHGFFTLNIAGNKIECTPYFLDLDKSPKSICYVRNGKPCDGCNVIACAI